MAESQGLAERVVAAHPENQMASILLALEDARAERWQAAEARMRGLPKTGLANVTAPMIEAWALAGAGKTDDALRALDQLSGLRGFGVLHDFHAAFINDLAGRKAAAEAAYAAALLTCGAGLVSARRALTVSSTRTVSGISSVRRAKSASASFVRPWRA